jgi:2'-phosphotransferase
MVLKSTIDSNGAQDETNTTESADPTTQPLPSSDNPSDYLIRANQGHSLKVEAEGLLKPITAETAPETVVHGTTHSAWPLIVASGGLKPMGRNHAHFASGLPAGFKSLVEEGEAAKDAAPVISGMRKSSTVLMFLDIGKVLLEDGKIVKVAPQKWGAKTGGKS